jgi:predicted ATPase
MRLDTLRIRGFRSLRDAQLDGLQAVNALVGRNNSGKTALLESLLMLAAVRRGDVELESLATVLPWERDLLEVIAESLTDLPGSGFVDLTLTFGLTRHDLDDLVEGLPDQISDEVISKSRLTYELRVASAMKKWPASQMAPVKCTLIIDERSLSLREWVDLLDPSLGVSRPSGEGVLRQVLSDSSSNMSYHVEGLDLDGDINTALRGIGAPELCLLAGWIKKIRYLGRTRQGDPAVALANDPRLRSDGGNLARYFQHLLTNEPLKWVELKAILRQLVPWLQDVFTPIDEGSTSTRVAVTDRQDAAEAFDLSHMGAGTTHLMTIVAMVWGTPKGGLCLVEEPEQGLHGSAQRDLALWLAWHTEANDKQLILATHSPIFARLSGGTSAYLSTFTPEFGTKFRRLMPEDAPAVAEELGLRLIDVYSYDCLLFIEADTEMRALPHIFQALDMDLEFLGIRMVPLAGDTATRLRRLREYLGYMRGAQIIPFVLLDEDRGVNKEIQNLKTSGLLDDERVWLWKRGQDSPGEFEDNFSDAQLIHAVNQLAKEGGSSHAPLTTKDLAQLRGQKPKTMTSKLLAELYYDRHNYGLNKPSLGEILGKIAAEGIAYGDMNHPVVTALEKLRASVRGKGEKTHG